jgi:hypothetical protein
MERKRQREIALVVAAGAIVTVAAYWAGWMSPAPDPATPAAIRGAAPREEPPSKGQPTEVDLAALKAPRAEPGDSFRNPFRFRPKPAPAPPPVQIAPKPGQLGPGEHEEPPPPPPPPRIALKFIGTAEGKVPGRVAILRDERGVYYGHEGDIIEGRYRILRIGVESIELAYLDGSGRQTIRQTGQ